MKRATLDRTGKVAQLLGGVLCAALGLRVMTLAVGEAQARRAPEAGPITAAPRPEENPRPTTARERHKPAPERATAEAGAPLRLMLSVNAGPERSEVYVNGSRLGLSPYVGDYSCKQGEQLRVEIVPPRGALVTRAATCEGRTLLIR